MLEMVTHQAPSYSAKGFLYRRNLHHYIGAVAVRLDHASEAANLALDAMEPFQVGRFDSRVHGDGFARRTPGDFTGASRALLFCDLPNVHRCSIPLGGILGESGCFCQEELREAEKRFSKGFSLYDDNYQR